MSQPKILEYFLTNERLYDWFGNANDFDCKPWSYLSYDDIIKYQLGLDFGDTLIVLFVRDTSTWNDGRKGLVITDHVISIKKSTKDIIDIDDDDWDVVSWEEIDHVKYHFGFDFYNASGETILTVPTEYLFKGYVEESVKNELAHHLTEMAKLANESPVDFKCPICGDFINPSFKRINNKYLERTDLSDAEKKIGMANDSLVSYIWFLSGYFVLFPNSDDPHDYLKSSKIMSKGGHHAKGWFFTHCYDMEIKCDHHDWNLFDEFDTILSTNDEFFIQKSLTVLNADIYCDGFWLSEPQSRSRNLIEPMNALISLVKARCYYKLSQQTNRSSDDRSKFMKLATDYLSEYEKCPQEFRNTTLLSTYEAESRNEMSNNTSANSNTGIDSVISLSEFSEAEQKYMEAYHSIIIDGSISESDRRMLERLRSSLAISKMDAAELEAIISSRLHENQAPELTDDEQEYLDTVKDYLADGEINERRRRMLDSYRDSLGISEQRAKELESMVK